MNSIGERLQQERLRQGLDLNQIAELTKIGPIMLEAIEADDYDRLPGSFFARSFVRQYAQALGLDEEQFESELMRVAVFGHPATEQPQPAIREVELRPEPVPPSGGPPGKRPLGSLVAFLVILAACSAVYTLWQKPRGTPSAPPPMAATVASPTPMPTPEPTLAPTPEATPTPEAAAPPESPAPTATPAPDATAAPRPAQSAPAPDAASRTQTAAAPTPAPAATAVPRPASAVGRTQIAAAPAAGRTPRPAQTAAAPAAAPEPAAGIHIELRATSQAWVRVVSDGKTVYSGVLQPNEARVFVGTTLLTLRAGNAAALAATFNGKPLGELGQEGQVRTIQFTPSGFQFVAPTPASAADQP